MFFDAEKFNEWFRNIEGFVINDIRDCLNNNKLETGLIILTLVGTECVSGYYAGDIACKTTFKLFMDDYFPPSYAPYPILIYESLRNGLLHDHTIKKPDNWLHSEYPFNFNREAGAPHLMPRDAGQDYPIMFNRVAFAIDFLNAWADYVNDLVKDPALQTKLVERHNKRPYLIVT